MAVAMSGGADSTAALALLKEAGHEVFGITAIMTRERSRCCAPEDVECARNAARRLDVPHETVEVQDAFDTDVIGYFVAEYLAGRTPSPCVVCNSRIKFGVLLDEARRRGADFLATGHYARSESGPDGKPELLRGADAAKDQSYFLARLTGEQVRSALFPLGGMTKAETLSILAARGLARPGRRESQDVCFVPDGDHGRWLDLRVLKTPPPGDIVTADGKRVGRHNGIHHYTVGQRKGLGIASGAPMYVVRIDARRNELVVGAPAEATTARIGVEGLSWIAGKPPARSFEALVQIRFRHEPAAAQVVLISDDAAEVEFVEPQFGAAPGQSAVFCRGDKILGAAWIGVA